MKLCYFNDYRLGVIKGDTVVDITDAVKDIPHLDSRDLIIGLIAKWDSYKGKVEKSITRTWRSVSASPAARFVASDDLPTPPLRFAIAMTCMLAL